MKKKLVQINLAARLEEAAAAAACFFMSCLILFASGCTNYKPLRRAQNAKSQIKAKNTHFESRLNLCLLYERVHSEISSGFFHFQHGSLKTKQINLLSYFDQELWNIRGTRLKKQEIMGSNPAKCLAVSSLFSCLAQTGECS